MSLLRCEHCRYLFEATRDVCPLCGRRPAPAGEPDEALEGRRTVKRPAIRPKPLEKDK